MNQKITLSIYVAGYLIMFGAWFAIVGLKIQGADDMVQYIKSAMAMLSGHVLTMVYPRQINQSTEGNQ